MKYPVNKKLGGTVHTFIVEGNNLFDLVQESQKFSFHDVYECGICGSPDLKLNSRLAQNKYKYVEVKCNTCNAALTFGNKTDDPNVYYLRRNANKQYDWKEYTPKEN